MNNPTSINNETPLFKYDVFLSHSSKDKAVVRELAARLQGDGIRIWFDEWIIQPGDIVGLKTEQGLEESRVLVLAMSVNSFASEWVKLERHTALFRDPTNSKRRFIPLLLENCQIKDTLKQFLYVDWRTRNNDQYERLLAAVSPTLEPSEFEAEDTPEEKIKAVKTLKGHRGVVNSVAISGDTKYIVSGADDGNVCLWETATGKLLNTFIEQTNLVLDVAISGNGKRIVSCSYGGGGLVWGTNSGKRLSGIGQFESINSVAITSDGKKVAANSKDRAIRIWEVGSGKCLTVLGRHTSHITSVAITPNGNLTVSGSEDKTVRVWETDSGRCLSIYEGHTEKVRTVAVTTNGELIVSASDDKTIRVWEMVGRECIAILKGHTKYINSVAVSGDGRLIVSGSDDNTVRVWEVLTGKCLSIFEGHTDSVKDVAISLDGKFIVSCSKDKTIRLWNSPQLSGNKNVEKSVSNTNEEVVSKYTNAKVLLVGDSGVGKSGLAYRLAEDMFVETVSTDGVWATQLKLSQDIKNEDTEREIWLWDFAGQSDYRLIHQLFMDETALAVLVFNPQHDNPFQGLMQWDNDLRRAARRPFNKLLVAGRCDRGGLTISSKSLIQFQKTNGFAQYLETSALVGAGCKDLKEAIIKHINWENIPHRTSPQIFKLLKDEIIKLKDEGKVLLRVSELKQQLEMRLSDEHFTIEELEAVIGLLAGAGVVWQLEFGDFVLLQPERINSYAASVVRSVREHVEEIGCIAEERVLRGELDYQDMERLPRVEEDIVLRAMHQTFVEHGLCFRETTDVGVMLVFPSYFKRERPEQEKHPAALVTYKFSGMLEAIYATLVVRLHHTQAFEKDQLWRYAADFKTQSGKRVGLKMVEKNEGTAEITIYFDNDIPDEIKAIFIRYVQDHLQAKDEKVVRVRHYVCPHCGEPFENENAIQIRINKGLKDILCPVCEERFELWDLIEEKFSSDEFQQRVREMEEEAKISIDNESRELVLVGHTYAIAGEAGQIFRQTSNSDWGIDGEIEFKDYEGNASGKRVYLQLKSGDSHLQKRKRDEKEIFYIKARHAEYWQSHNYPVMLVIRNSDNEIRWMNVTEYLKQNRKGIKHVVFNGEPFTSLNLVRLRDRLLN